MTKNSRNHPFPSEKVVRGMLLNILVNFPFFLSLGILITTNGPLTPFRLGLMSFIAGFSGVIIMIRKEIPTSFLTIKGKWAVIQGVVLAGVCWSFTAYFWFLT